MKWRKIFLRNQRKEQAFYRLGAKLEAFFEENASLTMTSIIGKIAEAEELYKFRRTIERLMETLEHIMNRPSLFYLVMCCLLFPCTDSFAAEPDALDSRSHMERLNDYWGEDVVLAAIYAYGWGLKNYEDFEGRMFPLYLGYISFDDSGEQKMIYFTSSHQANTLGIEAIYENINSQRGKSYVQWFSSIDDPDFCSGVFSTLRNLNILPVIRLPLGTAKDYDFAFKEQTEFKLEEAETILSRNEGVKLPADWGISEDNLIMTPKQ